jgi:hypothetical protein
MNFILQTLAAWAIEKILDRIISFIQNFIQKHRSSQPDPCPETGTKDDLLEGRNS